MYRPLTLHPARPAAYLSALRQSPVSRRLATAPNGQPHSTHRRSEGNNTVIILSALGALGGLYYYYTRGQPGIDREAARRKEEEVEKKVKDIGESTRSKLESVEKQGKIDYDQAKATVQDSVTAARTRATEARANVTERARQGAHDAQVKYDELKNATEQRIGDVRDHSEKKIEESKEEAARRAREAGSKTRGWFGWGGDSK